MAWTTDRPQHSGCYRYRSNGNERDVIYNKDKDEVYDQGHKYDHNPDEGEDASEGSEGEFEL